MKLDIVRAWKDESYRLNLSGEQLSQLPANPAGDLELSDADLGAVYGGGGITLIRISHISLFSINLLASPFNQTCFQNRS